ncbi:MAG: M28 family peptidase [Spirochaetales bacterium]|nr:M28 family peptidase [Spirochaetales bacterium]
MNRNPQSRGRKAMRGWPGAVALSVLLVLGACARDVGFSDDHLADFAERLSSDDFQGRESGSRFSRRAARLLEEHYRQAGLVPAFGNSYLQPFGFEAGVEAGASSIAWTHDEREIVFENAVPMPLSRPGEAEGPLIYGGMCIDAPDRDDFAGLDVRNRIVLCLRYGPGGKENETYAREITFQHKFKAISERGAAGVVFLGTSDSPGARAEAFSRVSFSPGPIAVFLDAPAFFDEIDFLEEDEQRLLRGEPSEHRGALLGRLRVRSDFRTAFHLGTNVGAYLRPFRSDQRLIVLGAHLDHLGPGYFSSLGEADQIHNGADDNASGTALVLGMGLALRSWDSGHSEAPPGVGSEHWPDDFNVLFLHFDGEERGLLGSRRFVGSRYFAPQQTVAMLNYDMVGRLRPDKGLALQGADTAGSQWREVIQIAYDRAGLKQAEDPDAFPLRLIPGGYGPSDHSSFYEKGVPVAFFFTGSHPQYHTPDDDFDLLNTDGMARIGVMAFSMIDQLSASGLRLSFVRAREEPRRSAFEFRVRLGILPAYDSTDADEGLLVAGVREDAPIRATGIRAGDVIVRIGDKQISNIYDLMDFLGDATTARPYRIVFKRGDQTIESETMLMAAP